MRLRRATEGVTLVEHLLVIVLVALCAAGAWSLLGDGVEERVSCVAEALGDGGASCGRTHGGAAGRARAALTTARARDSRPASRRRDALTAGRGYASRVAASASSIDGEIESLAHEELEVDAPDAGAGDGCGWNPFCYGYRVGRGFVRAGVDTVKGVAHIGASIVTDPIGSLEALGSAIVHPTKIWRMGETIVGGIWANLKAAAHGDPDAIGRLGFDVLLTVGTGGTAKAAATAIRARLFAYRAGAIVGAARVAEGAAAVADDVGRVEALAGDAAAASALSFELEARAARVIEDASFVTRRGFGAYDGLLGGDFTRSVRTLGPEDSWIDMGAGDARAMRDVFSKSLDRPPPRMSALGHAPPRDPSFAAFAETAGDRFTPLYGRMLEDYPIAELGTHELVSDLYGPFSYAPHMDEVLETYGRIAKVDGDVYVLASWHFNRIVDDLGHGVSLDEWARSIEGLELVSREAHAGSVYALHFRRVAGEVHVPRLELRKLDWGQPPDRLYVWHRAR